MKRTATAIVSIANSDGIERTVYLQFRKNDATPEDEWSDPPLEEDKDTDIGSASIPMESLDPGTDYEVQASFDNTFPEDETKTKKTTFTTKFLPRVSNVRVVPNSITKTTATAEVSIANPDGTLQTVHLRYIVYSANAGLGQRWHKSHDDQRYGDRHQGPRESIGRHDVHSAGVFRYQFRRRSRKHDFPDRS